MKNTGWVCPKCERVYAPFIMECSNCNNNEIKTDPCIITPPWTQDYSKYKSEVTTDTYKCNDKVEDTVYISSVWGDNTTRTDYGIKLDKDPMLFSQMICDSQGCREVDLFGRPIKGVHKYSSQETLQESLDGLNKELENHGVQPINLDELKDIKAIIEDIHQSEEITQDESNNTLDNNTSTQDSKNNFLRRVFPIGGINRGKHRIITKCEHCGATAYLNKKCPICDKFNGDKSLESDTSYMLEHWICSRCGKVHLVFPESGCECGAPLEYLTYII